MSDRVGVSIVIPCYRASQYLFDAIDSVLDQNLDPSEFEIIIVDDKYPADDLQAKQEHLSVHDLLTAQIQSYPNIRIIESCEKGKNNGQSAARNAGIRAAKFPFIMGLDADDLLKEPASGEESFIKLWLQNMSRNPNVAYAESDLETFGQVSSLFPIHTLSPENRILGQFKPNVGMFRKDDALYVDGYDETMTVGEDIHFFAKLLAGRLRRGLGVEIGHTKEALYRYRLHPDGAGNVSDKRIDQKSFCLKLVSDALPYFQLHFGHGSAEELAEKASAHRSLLISKMKHGATEPASIAALDA